MYYLFLIFCLIISHVNGNAHVNISSINIITQDGDDVIKDVSIGLDEASFCTNTKVVQGSMFSITNNASHANLDVIENIDNITSCHAFESYTIVISNDNTIINYQKNNITLDTTGPITTDTNAAETRLGVCDTTSVHLYGFNDTTNHLVSLFEDIVHCDGVAVGETEEGDMYFTAFDSVSGNITIYNNVFEKVFINVLSFDTIIGAYNGKFVLQTNDNEFKTFDMITGALDSNTLIVDNTGIWTVGKNDGSLIIQDSVTNNMFHYEWLENSWDSNIRYTIEHDNILDDVDAFHIGSYIYVDGWEWNYVDAETFTDSPTSSPTNAPSSSPTNAPTSSPTNAPTSSPSSSPTLSPTSSPTLLPSSSPTTGAPSPSPTTSSPTINAPTVGIIDDKTDSVIIVVGVVVASLVFMLGAVYAKHVADTRYKNNHWNFI